jgi:hypothetical protein
MITYVNTVLVSNVSGTNVASALTNTNGADNGKYVVINADTNAIISTAEGMDATVKRIKVGMFTGETSHFVNPQTKVSSTVPVIRWSNIINRDDIKKFSKLSKTSAVVTEDSVSLNFRSIPSTVTNKWAEGGKRIIVRLTFKDLPTRYRKWTESYEYVTVAGDTVNSIVKGIVNLINKQVKRARVIASLGTASAGSNAGDPDTIAATASGSESGANAVILTAMPYDDDNSAESLNRFDKVRFNANIYWTDPAAEGWAALNKNFPQGLIITKTPGFQYAASGKLVRDREQAALGYMGILNHGEGTWPIVQPAMNVNIAENYNAVTLEFENMYHTADDLMRKTKQTVELYFLGNFGSTNTIDAILAAFAGAVEKPVYTGPAYQPADAETEDFSA